MQIDVAAAKRKPISQLTAEERRAIWESEQPTTAPRAPTWPAKNGKSEKREESKPAQPEAEPDQTDTVFDDPTLLADHGNAARFLNAWGALTRYVYPFKKFFCFDNGRWSDDQRLVEDRANRTVKGLKAPAEDIVGFKHYLKSQSPERRSAMLTLARAEIGIDPDEFDADPDLFNVANGTIHLPTGEFRAHNPKDLCTKISKVTFDKDAKCPLWLKFLSEIFNNDQKLIDFIMQIPVIVNTKSG